MEVTTKKRQRAPAIYEIVQARELYTMPAKKPEEEKAQARALHKMGAINITRSMLRSKVFIDMNRSTKPVYIWLMAKEGVIKQKVKAGIKDDEAQRYTDKNLITTAPKEIEKYTGIRADNVTKSLDELQAAGLIRYKKETIGGRAETKIYYRLSVWPRGNGYIKLPLITLVTPAYVNLQHNDKILYLVMLSQHYTEKHNLKKENGYEVFPGFMLAYPLLQLYGIKSTATLSESIRALEEAGMLNVAHGEWNANPAKGRANIYAISTDFLYTTTITKTTRRARKK